jgi:hypothetical protein
MKYGGPTLGNLAAMILESAAIYVAFVVAGLILLLQNNPCLYLILTPVSYEYSPLAFTGF